MNLMKNLICLTLANCVALTSVTSQAILTKELVIKSADQLTIDSKSDLTIDDERGNKQCTKNTLKATLELTATTHEKSSAEKPLTVEQSTNVNHTAMDTDMKTNTSADTKPSTVDTSSAKEKVKDPNPEEVIDADKSTVEQAHESGKDVNTEPDVIPIGSKDKIATEQKQEEEETTKVNQATPITDEKDNSTEEKVHEPEKISEKDETDSNKILEEQQDLAIQSQEVATKSTYTDKKYVTEALNLIDPYIYHLTKVTKNFRFYDISKEKISIHNMEWRYQDDEGKGSTNYMKLLFPSNAGELNADTSANRECFSSTCKPTAKLIADMECYFHNYVRNPEYSDKAQEDLTKLLMKKDANFLRKILLQTEAKDILKKHKIEIPEGKQKISDYPINDDTVRVINQSKDKDKLVCLHNHLNPKNQISVIDQGVLNKLRENIKNGTFDYLSIDHFVKFDEGKKVYEVDSNSFKMVIRLLNEGSYMIKYQETDGMDPKKILPKYITERMLMVYFFITKSTQSDITEFYDCVKEKLGANIVDSGSPEEALSRLSKRANMLQRLSFNNNSPYKTATLENSSTYSISKVSDDRQISFQKQTFQDCADIAIRHVINLLTYDKEHKWNKLLVGIDDTKKAALLKEREKILKAIEQYDSVEFKTLAERLQIFFLHQEIVGADAVDINTRSLWNYAISNMNQEHMEGLYPIEYAGKKNYELVSGFENSLKMLYNIACALKITSDKEKTQAKKAIDNLIQIENDEGKKRLRNAIEAVYKLFNENIEVSENSQFKLSNNKLNWIGKAVIKSDTNSFEVGQIEGHTRIIFDPIEKYDFDWLDKNKEDVFKDDIAMLLVVSNLKVIIDATYDSSKYNVIQLISGCNDPKMFKHFAKEFSDKLPLFYKLYSEGILVDSSAQRMNFKNEKLIRDFKNPEHKNYISNLKALKFLKELQGEQNNKFRVRISCGTLYGINFNSITLKYKIGKQDKKLGEFIINNYLLKESIMNPEIKPWGETLRKINPDNVIQYDGVEYYCTIDKDSVTLYPCKVEKTEVLIPANVRLSGKEYKVVALGAYAFCYSGVKKISFEEGIKDLNLSSGVCMGCANLEEINFANSTEKLDFGANAFLDCEKLKTITIPDLVHELHIGLGCFISSAVCGIKMPTSLRILHISSYAFSALKSLNAFNLNDGLKELHVGNAAFDNTSLASFKVPTSVTDLKIERNVFDGCEQLKELTIPEGKKGIEISEDVKILSDQLKAAKV